MSQHEAWFWGAACSRLLAPLCDCLCLVVGNRAIEVLQHIHSTTIMLLFASHQPKKHDLPCPQIFQVSWSPDGTHVAFTVRSPGGPSDPPRGPLQLWIADVSTCEARPLLPGRGLNTVFDSYSWVDDTTIVACCIPEVCGRLMRGGWVAACVR